MNNVETIIVNLENRVTNGVRSVVGGRGATNIQSVENSINNQTGFRGRRGAPLENATYQPIRNGFVA